MGFGHLFSHDTQPACAVARAAKISTSSRVVFIGAIGWDGRRCKLQVMEAGELQRVATLQPGG